uniref:Uncharacterized protein n=1 Tax=Cucumis melo TaxID=3656 RepID=A0A9I9EAE3_CUCME
MEPTWLDPTRVGCASRTAPGETSGRRRSIYIPKRKKLTEGRKPIESHSEVTFSTMMRKDVEYIKC